MADFCQQCSIEHFGKDLRELAGLGDGTALAPGEGWNALCEGCGSTVVDDEGRCIAGWCRKHATLWLQLLVDEANSRGRAEVAEQLGISDRTIYRWLSREDEPTQIQQAGIIALLGRARLNSQVMQLDGIIEVLTSFRAQLEALRQP